MASSHDRSVETESATLQEQVVVVELTTPHRTSTRCVAEHDRGRFEAIPQGAGVTLLANGNDAPGSRGIERKHNVETSAVISLCSAWNCEHGTSLIAVHVNEEDPDFKRLYEGWDGLLVQQTNPRTPVEYVQVARVDADLPRDLARQARVHRRYDTALLAAKIASAVANKRRKYPDEAFRERTHLVLVFPTGLGAAVRQGLVALTFDLADFRSLWIAPVGEAAFQLRPK